MIRGVFGVVKGGFWGIRRWMAGGGSFAGSQDGGFPPTRDMTGWGGREWGNAKAQGRNEEEEGDSRLRGNDEEGAGMVGWGM